MLSNLNYKVEADKEDDLTVESQRDCVKILADQGIAVITSSGNWAQTNNNFDAERKRTGIDTIPSVFASLHPMVPMGNIDWNRELQAYS